MQEQGGNSSTSGAGSPPICRIVGPAAPKPPRQRLGDRWLGTASESIMDPLPLLSPPPTVQPPIPRRTAAEYAKNVRGYQEYEIVHESMHPVNMPSYTGQPRSKLAPSRPRAMPSADASAWQNGGISARRHAAGKAVQGAAGRAKKRNGSPVSIASRRALSRQPSGSQRGATPASRGVPPPSYTRTALPRLAVRTLSCIFLNMPGCVVCIGMSDRAAMPSTTRCI